MTAHVMDRFYKKGSGGFMALVFRPAGTVIHDDLGTDTVTADTWSVGWELGATTDSGYARYDFADYDAARAYYNAEANI